MDKNLGKQKSRIRTNLACVVPLFYTVAALLMLGLLVFPASTLGENPLYSIIAVGAAVLLTTYIFVQIFYCHIMLYENGIEIVSTFNKKVIMRDEISVIYWDKPGAFEGTTRTVVRKNNGAAEVMLKDGKKIRIPDSVYKNVEKLLGEWQAEYNIPREY